MQFQKQVTNANVDLCIQGCMSEYSGLPEYQTMDAIITYRFVWGCRINRLSTFTVNLQTFNDIRSELEYSKSISAANLPRGEIIIGVLSLVRFNKTPEGASASAYWSQAQLHPRTRTKFHFAPFTATQIYLFIGWYRTALPLPEPRWKFSQFLECLNVALIKSLSILLAMKYSKNSNRRELFKALG